MPCYSYYSWTATTLGSGLDIITDDTDAPYSICPKNWILPNSRSTVSGNSDFYQLAVAYGMVKDTVVDEETDIFYINAGPNTIANYLLTGGYSNNSPVNIGTRGQHWSSTSYSANSQAHHLNFGTSFVNSAGASNRRSGLEVRCLAQ